MQLQVRTRYGKQEEAVVTGIIKEGLRRLERLVKRGCPSGADAVR